MTSASTHFRALSHEPRFLDEFVDLPREAQKKIARAVKDLQTNPGSHSVRLQGSDGMWRREVSPYRVFFALGDSWVHVYSVRHRQGAYAGGLVRAKAVPQAPSEEFPPLDIAEPEPTAETGPVPATQELVDRARACTTPDELLSLIDLGLPDWIFNEVSAQLRNAIPPVGTIPRLSNVTLVRQRVIEAFFGSLLRLPETSQIVELVIVSPWITSWDGRNSSLDSVLSKIGRHNIPTTVITRPPEMPTHVSAISKIRDVLSAEILELPGLHAKYFICDVAPVPFALLGSANATAGSMMNYEVGVMVRGSGNAEPFVRDLQSLTNDLRIISKRTKRKGRI